MSKIILIGSAITVSLFLIGVALLSYAEVFSDYWLTGVGLMGLAMVIIVITLVVKFRS